MARHLVDPHLCFRARVHADHSLDADEALALLRRINAHLPLRLAQLRGAGLADTVPTRFAYDVYMLADAPGFELRDAGDAIARACSLASVHPYPPDRLVHRHWILDTTTVRWDTPGGEKESYARIVEPLDAPSQSTCCSVM